MNALDAALIAVISLVGVATLVHLWRRREERRLAFKLVWSAVVLLPLIGPLLYGALYDGPPTRASHGDDSPPLYTPSEYDPGTRDQHH
jgi:hypothetical protein